VGVVTATLPARAPGLRFLALAGAAPVSLALSRLLPAHGLGLGFRLLAAAVCVLLVPGALLLRTLAWPSSVALAAAGSFALSLVVVFFALALVFAAQASLTLALVVIVVVSLGALVPAALAPSAPVERADLLAAGGVVLAGLVFAGIVWWSTRTLGGDALFHAARARKLDGLSVLTSVNSVDEFRDGGLHPGYAFPLWHAVLALVSRLAGVDVAVTVLRLSAVLVPLAFLLTYAAGRELFRSWAGGVAVAAGQLALLGLGRAIPGSYAFLALPATAARVLLPAAVLALAFAFVAEGRRPLLFPLAGGALVLAAVHPTYAIFLALAFAGFVAARLILIWDERRVAARGALALASVSVPPALFFVWLLPAVRGTASVTPTAEQKARDLAHYAGYFEGSGHLLRLAPDALARGGPAVVAAFLVVPLAALAGRRLWASYVLGGTLAVLAVLLLPLVFETFADTVSLSQARRLAAFLPLAFALAGAAALAGRLRLAGVAAAGALGLVLTLAYPGEFTYRVKEGGPGWAILVAAVGGLAALAIGARLGRLGPVPATWAALAALAFALPVAVAGAANLHRQPRDPQALTPGLVAALRADVQPGQVLFGDVEAMYRAAAYVPAYVAAGPPAHVAVNAKNRPLQRRVDMNRFFDRRTPVDERGRLLQKYSAQWVLVDRSRSEDVPGLGSLRRVYEDRHYALYRVGR
jgi:hypothetical protein